MEEGPQILPPPATLEPISRPSSTSTSASGNLTQLPGISSLAANGATSSPQPRVAQPPPPSVPIYTGASPAATTGGGGNGLPTCQNCNTSTTPLWRRDEYGAVLCNACGLFLKLHGRPRPISLKTDVIKSRNRIKTARHDVTPKKRFPQAQQQQQQQQQYNVSAEDLQHSTAAQAAQAALRASHRNGDGDSPLSRAGTPSLYKSSLAPFMVDEPYHSTAGAGGQGADGSTANGERHPDTPETLEQILNNNSVLKTRVSELELIHELFRGRLDQLEQQEAAARKALEDAGAGHSAQMEQMRNDKDAQLAEKDALLADFQAQLDDSHRRENNLKRRLDEMDQERQKDQEEHDSARPAKKARTDSEQVKNEA